MFDERAGRDPAPLAMTLFRVGIVLIFVIMLARMFQLQVLRGSEYETLANENRLERIETAPPRGVIYDRNDTILVRNRPSFEVAPIPEFLPFDDIETEDVDEEAARSRRHCACCAPMSLPAATPTWHCASPRSCSESSVTRTSRARCKKSGFRSPFWI